MSREKEIIDPRQTRRLLCEFAELAAPLPVPGRTWFGWRPQGSFAGQLDKRRKTGQDRGNVLTGLRI